VKAAFTRVALGGLVIMGLVFALLWTLQRQLIYLPSRGPVPPAAAVLDHANDVQLRTSDGLDLGAWFIQPTGKGNGVTVLVANGKAVDRSLRAPLMQGLAGRGFAVLLFDYRGYGGNPGSPSEEGLARDIRAAHRFLVAEAVVAPDLSARAWAPPS
jgi:hypothetical protein